MQKINTQDWNLDISEFWDENVSESSLKWKDLPIELKKEIHVFGISLVENAISHYSSMRDSLRDRLEKLEKS